MLAFLFLFIEFQQFDSITRLGPTAKCSLANACAIKLRKKCHKLANWLNFYDLILNCQFLLYTKKAGKVFWQCQWNDAMFICKCLQFICTQLPFFIGRMAPINWITTSHFILNWISFLLFFFLEGGGLLINDDRKWFVISIILFGY